MWNYEYPINSEKIRIFNLLKQSKLNKSLEEIYLEPFIKNLNMYGTQCVK